jgi:hypothetical protein
VKIHVIAVMLCLLGGANSAAAHQQDTPPAHQTDRAEFARGVAEARSTFARGKAGWYFYSYSNMPNGPDDPILARERDLFIAVLKEKGIEALSSNSACIPGGQLAQFAEGYNSIADVKLRAKYGDNYMALLKQEVSRRMRAAP